jgi:hypothetical protein
MTDDPNNSVHEELRAVEGEFVARGEGAPAPDAAPASGEGESAQAMPPIDWTVISSMLVMVLDRGVAPNWELQPHEKDVLFEGIKATLTVCFPQTKLDPRVQAVLGLSMTVAVISAARFDPSTKAFKPLRKPKPDDAPRDEHAEATEPPATS